jgi:L-alanine-DL-glutamate epimerase-like enolase superfamily enzyme
MNIAAGEYGYDLWYFRRMMDAGAVDIQQADATRCAGITGFSTGSTLCVSPIFCPFRPTPRLRFISTRAAPCPRR